MQKSNSNTKGNGNMTMTNTKRLQKSIADMEYCHKEMGALRDQLEALRCIMLDAIREMAEITKNHLRGGAKTTPEHPDTLTTEEEYKNAPGGTIVADDSSLPACLWGDGKWALWMELASHRDMSGTTRRVLRWGWEA